MSLLSPIVSRYSFESITLLDVIEISKCILNNYGKNAAFYFEYEISYSDQEAELNLVLSLRLSIDEHIQYEMDILKIAEGFLRENFTSFDKGNSAIGRSIESSSHKTKWDSIKNTWINVIYQKYEEKIRNVVTISIIVILESEPENRRQSRIMKNIPKTVDNSIKLKEYYNGRYIHFHERVQIFSRNNVVDGAENDVDSMIILSTYIRHKFSYSSFISRNRLQDCWHKALVSRKRCTGLPWELGTPPGANVPTATVSIDLRKSTTLMEQVENRVIFARWLESLSEICRVIVHDHGGIFDKFTGDGVLAHFATDSVSDDAANAADEINKIIYDAFVCGCELVRAVSVHLEALRPYLRIDIGAAGPTVGIAFDDASWALDRDGRPVVVGRGVVNACRLGSGPVNSVILANNLKHRLEHRVSSEILTSMQSCDVKWHKDLNLELQPKCYLLSPVPDVQEDVGRGSASLREHVVVAVSKRIDLEHEQRSQHFKESHSVDPL